LHKLYQPKWSNGYFILCLDVGNEISADQITVVIV
jgi:hypothetical protein